MGMLKIYAVMNWTIHKHQNIRLGTTRSFTSYDVSHKIIIRKRKTANHTEIEITNKIIRKTYEISREDK